MTSQLKEYGNPSRLNGLPFIISSSNDSSSYYTMPKSRKIPRITHLFHGPSVSALQDQYPEIGPHKMIVGYKTPPKFLYFLNARSFLPRVIVTYIHPESLNMSILISIGVVPGWREIWFFMMAANQIACLWLFSTPKMLQVFSRIKKFGHPHC